MEPDPAGDRSAEDLLAELATALVDGVVAALPDWVARCVEARSPGGAEVLPERVAEAGRHAADEVGERLRTLLAADVDEQWTGPLALLRDAARYPTVLLAAAGVAPVNRDADAERMFPDDPYDLTPASFADVHPDLLGPGVAWGAGKAYVHRRRHLGEDRWCAPGAG